MESKCPRQQAFIERLIKLFDIRDNAIINIDQSELMDDYETELERFVNHWCPTLKDWEESKCQTSLKKYTEENKK